jgi:hypothetical protein
MTGENPLLLFYAALSYPSMHLFLAASLYRSYISPGFISTYSLALLLNYSLLLLNRLPFALIEFILFLKACIQPLLTLPLQVTTEGEG